MTIKKLLVKDVIQGILKLNPDKYGAITVLIGNDYKHFPSISYKKGVITGGRCKKSDFLNKGVANYSSELSEDKTRQDFFIFVEGES